MTTVDKRTRFAGAVEVMDAEQLFGDLAQRLQDTGGLAARGVQILDLPPLTFVVDGTAAHLVVADGVLEVREGHAADGPAIGLDATACSELFQDLASTFGLVMPGRVEVLRPRADQFVAWEPVLRAAIDGRAVYEPGSIDFRDRDGNELDLRRAFRIDEPREDIGHFLAEAGYLHLEGMFSDAEMAAVSAELDAAIAAAERDDGASWWARTASGEWYPARILGFNQQSPTLRELTRSDRFRSIASFTDDDFVQRDPDVGDSAEGLLKKIDVVEGMSDVSWHKDCSLGGHSRGCSSLTVGISVTGAGRENGELGVVAGSRRANVPVLGVDGLDLPRVPLPTRTGDVTVHCSCTLHMSRPPVSAERRVVYTGFDLAPRPGDRPVELDPAEIRRRRAALDNNSGHLKEASSDRAGSFALD
jgi:Phytanoyl-CoA dioxygenase (PhyH)